MVTSCIMFFLRGGGGRERERKGGKGEGKKVGRKEEIKVKVNEFTLPAPQKSFQEYKIPVFYFFMFLTKTLVYWYYLSGISLPKPTHQSRI